MKTEALKDVLEFAKRLDVSESMLESARAELEALEKAQAVDVEMLAERGRGIEALKAQVAQARDAALEEAARLAGERSAIYSEAAKAHPLRAAQNDAKGSEADMLASAIRALKSTPARVVSVEALERAVEEIDSPIAREVLRRVKEGAGT